MAWLKSFGHYVPALVITNDEIATRIGCEPDWIFSVSGIRERRFAGEESLEDMATHAGEDCLARASINASQVGLLLVASGSAARRFPGPAVTVAYRLGLSQAVALDVPVPSVGSLIGLTLAPTLSAAYGNVLVIGAEKMSSVVMREPQDRNVAILFGDGAGACLVSRDEGAARIVDSALFSDGSFSEELRLEFDSPLFMNGRAVILQASRKIPRAIRDVLERNGRTPQEIDVFLMHQANRNLMNSVARDLGAAPEKFFSNIERYGNTSAASMLIAASEWSREGRLAPGGFAVLAGFGAGFHWGAVLIEGVSRC
jgi:3-oxoacyl-[acyl-carrier-protein] synthase-3